MRDHIQTLGLFQQPGVEALRESGDDPYDFKEGDTEYPFISSKRLKGQGREPSKKAKVGQYSLKIQIQYRVDSPGWVSAQSEHSKHFLLCASSTHSHTFIHVPFSKPKRFLTFTRAL